MKMLRNIFFLFLCVLFANSVFADKQADPATWSIEAKKIGGDHYNIVFHVNLKKDWHLYAQVPGGDGTLIIPSFTFKPNKDVKLIGKIKEQGKIVHEKDDIVGDFNYLENNITYTQEASIKANTNIKISYTYQTCNHSMCLPQVTKDYVLDVQVDGNAASSATAVASVADTTKAVTTTTTSSADTAAKPHVAAASGLAPVAPKSEAPQKSLLFLFLASLGGGLLAVLTPCVYSMIPITVSFFTKRSKTRAEGIKHAMQYSLSIIIIFTVLGVLISRLLGSNALNTLSTNWIANLFFFAIFIIFGISFLGAFEIQLPSSWTNKTDAKAGVGSFGGIFFMALTLVIVSFSCTGPIVGPMLVLAGKGGILGPALCMFGFSVGLALPFSLFAVFPGMLNKMAHSGGWLNQVKVVLGFIELMLALKFLSNADQSMAWRLLDREIFIAIWVVLSILIGLYLMGAFRMSHDDAPAKNVYGQTYVSIFKLILAITSFSFAVYMIPGMWGAPLNAISAFVPPYGTQDFILDSGSGNAGAASKMQSGNIGEPQKYVSDLNIYEPQVVKKMGLVTYYDYKEALAASKKYKKPLMLDFTGINCVNCRKMEGQVWSKPEVAKRLKENFIVVSLYCDMNKIVLPVNEQYFSKELNSQVTTLGNYNSDLQATKFGSNSQPYYFYIDENENKLVEEGYAYDPDVDKFVKHLDNVLAKYKATHP